MVRNLIQIAVESYKHLSTPGKKTLVTYSLSLVAISGLDAAGLAILARFFQVSGNAKNSSNNDTYILIGLVVFLFILRSVLATIVSYISINRFAEQEVLIGHFNLKRVQNLPWIFRKELKQSDYFSLVDRGPNVLVQGLLLSFATIVAEILSGIVIIGVLLIVQPLTAIVSFSYFLLVAMIQHRLLSVASARAGTIMNEATKETYDLLVDGSEFSKLMQVMPSKSYENSLDDTRRKLANARARVNFLSTLPRYFMEGILAFGFVVIAGFIFLVQGPDSVVPALTIFGAAGFRLLPIFNRIQGGILSSFSYEPVVRESFDLETQVNKSFPDTSNSLDKFTNSDTRQNGSSDERKDNILELKAVSYRYPDSTVDAVSNISLEIEMGRQYAIVGPSGSGKTTLVDIVLGLIDPDVGSKTWNRKNKVNIAYVPQESKVFLGNLFQNVSLEWNDSDIDPQRVIHAINRARLGNDFDANGRRGTDKVSSNNNLSSSLSGGEKQRLGLARAFYREANFIVFDEATSALDASLEHEIMEVVNRMRGAATTVIVAHRLSTIQNADAVIYMKRGKILGIGSFLELIKSVPDFERQVQLGEITRD